MTRSYLFLRSVLGGLVAGLAAALLSWLFDMGMDMLGFSFVPFSFAGHLVVLLGFNILGIIPLWLMGRYLVQPMPAFYTLSVVVGVVLSIIVTIFPPYESGFFVFVAIPGILLGALVSAVVATQIAYRGSSADPIA